MSAGMSVTRILIPGFPRMLATLIAALAAELQCTEYRIDGSAGIDSNSKGNICGGSGVVTPFFPMLTILLQPLVLSVVNILERGQKRELNFNFRYRKKNFF